MFRVQGLGIWGLGFGDFKFRVPGSGICGLGFSGSPTIGAEIITNTILMVPYLGFEVTREKKV